MTLSTNRELQQVNKDENHFIMPVPPIVVETPQTRHEIMRKQCLFKFSVFGEKFLNVPPFYIENAKKGLCKAKSAKFACVSEKSSIPCLFKTTKSSVIDDR